MASGKELVISDDWDDVLGAEPEDVVKSKEDIHKNSFGEENEDDDWGDAIAIEVLANYCCTLMKQMEFFRKQGIMCDGTIVVDDMELPVHKNILSATSPFFKNIFSQLTNPDDSKITLRNLTGQIMDDILHFAYTGEICIHDGNVRQLVATANFLQLQSLKDMTVNYLEQKLSPASAAEILILADKHNCKTLIQSAEKLIMDNFVIVSKTSGFKNLSFEIVHQLVKSEDIRVIKEEEVLEAVLTWVKSDKGNEKEKESHLANLLHEIRFLLISPSYLSETEKDEFVSKSSLCLNIIKEGINYHLSNSKHSIIDPKLAHPRKFMGVVCGIVCVGGWQGDKPTKDVFAYITSNYKWFPLAPLPKARYGHSVVSCKEFLYVIGGRNESTLLLSSVLKFDPTYNTWEEVAPLPYQVTSLGVCIFEDQLYCVGGLSSVGSIDIVLRYSSCNNVWQRLASLNCPRGALSVVASEKYMFAIGGIRKSGSGVNTQWEYLNTMEIYQRESNLWEYSTELLTKRAHASAVYLNHIIYLVGGQSELLGVSRGMDLYNTVAKEWSSVQYSGTPRTMSGIAVSETRFYVVGGMSKEGECLNTSEVYDTTKDRWTKISPLPVSTSSMQCCAINLRLAVLQGMTASFSE
ncbi:kelch-like protein 2 [Hydra vulgaris]|uniref:Kelch-like protein 2 n=1 Tax=Hydra vulgaris TaxID=6087 RepID=A0ABM4BLA9_HYDVU